MLFIGDLVSEAAGGDLASRAEGFPLPLQWLQLWGRGLTAAFVQSLV